MVKSYPFIGTEAEGPRKGQKTLFIPNVPHQVSINKIETILLSNDIQYIYFGAGNRPGIDVTTARNLYKLPKSTRIIIECVDVEQVYIAKLYSSRKDIEILYTINRTNTDIDNFDGINHIKIIGKNSLYWYEVRSAYLTQHDDELYKQDKVV